MSMLLSTLFQGTEYRLISGSMRRRVSSIEENSGKVVKDSLFVAIIGFEVDGHSYIPKAIENKAGCIVVDSDRKSFPDDELISLYGDSDITIIEVKSTRRALAILCAAFFNHPEDRMDLVGVTGTKGKTTTTYMIHNILELDDNASGLIGTVGKCFGKEERETKNTTPDAHELFADLEEMALKQFDSCVMEVSSQGLKLDRVYGIRFDIGCFTNFYEDHISANEHPDMRDYLESKLVLFDNTKTAVINADCAVAKQVINYASSRCPVYTYGLTEDSDCYAKNIRHEVRNGVSGSLFNLVCPWYEGEVFLSLPGKFNVYNALCAICTAGLLKVDFETVLKGLATAKVPGRVQPVENKLGLSILIDYAHNAASLESVLKSLSEYTKGDIISVFGCGGNRSYTRRREMGVVSGNFANYTIITSDNPRDEEPMSIIAMIEEGIMSTGGKYEVVEDRAQAIQKAISMAKPGDTVVIAGKGHENYQEFEHKRRIFFSDSKVASDVVLALEEKKQ